MKKTEKFVVIRSTETGQFLMKYKSNEGTFAYSATWAEDLQDASTGTLEAIEKQSDKMQKVAEAFGGELFVVNATYELETLDRNEPKDLTEEIEEAKRKELINLLNGLFSNDDEEED